MKKILSILVLVIILSGVAGNQAFATKDELPKLARTSSFTIELLK
ncbi:lipoprotein [Sporosarcina sp. YIM B06819]|nr:lipoprotein [Sporosarcina sp. YIM B06819]